MSTKYGGACHCKKVRYTCTAEPELTFYCHCRDCQRTTGSPFSVEAMISSDSFELEGELKTYSVKGDSGQNVQRNFCAHCGSGIYIDCDAYPGYVFLKVGTLDDATSIKPDMHIYTGAKQPWLKIGDKLPQHEKAPPE